MNKWVKFAIKCLVAIVLIALVFRSGQLRVSSLKDLFTPMNILFGIVLSGVCNWFVNWRWYWLLRSSGFSVTLRETLSLYLIGVFFNHALPSSVGGDVVKAFYIANHNKDRRMDAVLSVLIDRVLGLYSMLLMALFSVVMDISFVVTHPEIKVMAVLCGLLALAMTVSFAIGFSNRADRYLGVSSFLARFPKLQMFSKMFSAMQLFGRRKSVIVVSVLVSIVAQFMNVCLVAYVGWALGIHDVPWTAYLFCVPIGFVAMAVPIAPAGVGVGQVAFLFLFHAYAPNSGDLGAVGITAIQLLTLAWGLVGAIVYIRYKSPVGMEMSDARACRQSS